MASPAPSGTVGDQLFAVQQIYRGDTRWDSGAGRTEHLVPVTMEAATVAALGAAGTPPNAYRRITHDDVSALRETAARIDARQAADAYVASLWSAPWSWRAALPARALGLALPPVAEHVAWNDDQPHLCGTCGLDESAWTDTTQAWFWSMTEGAPSGDAVGRLALAASHLPAAGSTGWPVPTEHDAWTVRAVLTILRALPGTARHSAATAALKAAALLPAVQPRVYTSMLEDLALLGILATPEHPGMLTTFTTFRDRERRPTSRTEVPGPLAWWNASVGVDERLVEQVFGHLDTRSVDLAGPRPVPEPPLAETVTGALSRRRAPRTAPVPAAAGAGTGPVEPGDVYGIRVREGVWVTVFCHDVDSSGTSPVARVEFLDGVHAGLPDRAALGTEFKQRRSGRSQHRTRGLDTTSWVRRVARGVACPASDAPEPDRVPIDGAKELKHLAHWCFPDIDS